MKQSPEDIFDQATVNFGGRLRMEDRPGAEQFFLDYRHHRERYLDWLRANHMPTLPGIHIDFLNLPMINAVAFEDDQRGYIGIAEGTLGGIAPLFGRMLADPGILIDLGDPSVEKTGLPKLFFTDLAYEFDDSAINGDGTINSPYPEDQDRYDYASILNAFAQDFIFFHELGHIANGHTKFKRQETGNSLIAEGIPISQAISIEPPSAWNDALRRQVIEVDADMYAVTQGYAVMHGTISDPDKMPESWKRLLKSREDGYFAWLFAVATVMQVWGFGPFDPANLDALYYPPPALRFQYAAQALAANVERDFGSAEVGLIRKSLERALRESIRAFGIITGNPPTWNTYGGGSMVGTSEVLAHLPKLVRCYNDDVGPRLAPLMHKEK